MPSSSKHAARARVLRWLLGDRPGAPCTHCGKYLFKIHCTLDHVIPKSKGGKLTRTNTVIACRTCNMERGSRDYESFHNEKRDATNWVVEERPSWVSVPSEPLVRVLVAGPALYGPTTGAPLKRIVEADPPLEDDELARRWRSR